MFIAMNRFCIVKGKEIEFERIRAERDSHLDEVQDSTCLCADPRRKTTRCTPPIQSGRANSISRTGQNAEAFRKAHANARSAKDISLYSKASRLCSEDQPSHPSDYEIADRRDVVVIEPG